MRGQRRGALSCRWRGLAAVMTARYGRVMTAGRTDGNTPRRTIRIPDPLWLAAVAAAKERNESLSEEIRRFLRRYVRRSK